MALFRNYSNDAVSQSVSDEKVQGKNVERVRGIVENENVEATSSDKDCEIKMDNRYRSDDELDDVSRIQDDRVQDDAAIENGRISSLQPSGRRTALVGKWGSTFWKDCQPMQAHGGGSESGQESKSGSEYKSEEGSEGDSSDAGEARAGSEDDDEYKETEKVQRDHVDVPVDEMLSDDYYEQDGDDQSDSLPYRPVNHSSGYNSKPQSRSAANNIAARNSRTANGEEDDDEDADSDEDVNDGDDPDDADFDPEYGAMTSPKRNKDEDWDGEEDSDEDDKSGGDDEVDLDISGEDDAYKKPRGRKQGRGAHSVKSAKESKSFTSSRRKRGRMSFEEEDSSAKDSEVDSDEDFRSMTRRGAHSRKSVGGRSAYASGKYNEVRTSTRSVRKVSYVESEESEELDESKKKKSQKDDIEEEDGDYIEKVLWHQPKGTAEEAKRNQKSTEPVLLSQLFDAEPNWNEMEFLIKWKGQSHLHCQWKLLTELQNLSGFKKVINYTKKVMEDIRYRKRVSREEIEVNDVSKEMDLDIIKKNSQVERLIADRVGSDSSGVTIPEYLVKWQGLSYAEATWALLHFLDPHKFKSKDDFVQNYKNLSSFNEIELANLHMELRPHILRRIIKDVEKSLPPKIERILRVEMSPLQKQYYKWILERNFNDLNKGVRGNQVSLLNIVVELKKCCNHPFLFESADHGYGGDTNITGSSKLERIILSSGKLVILDKLLVRLHETNHRVLIFSQMVRMLDIVAEYLSLRGFQYQRLDGSTKAELRQQAMEHFNAPGSDDFCFLLSTRAGGLGINLATADTVIIFDSDWNPQNDLQAMSRAHRIGQQEVVNIYRFVTSKSVEEDILERAKKKMVLDHLVIQKLNAEGRLEKKEAKKGSSFDKNELSAILRFGAEELFKEEKNEEESKKRLLSMDIDEILERAEKVEEKEATEEQGNELLSAFKVANFGSAEDDGSFWSRWIKPDAIAHAEEALAPRAARNNKSYVEANPPERSNKRKKGVDPPERGPKRRKADTSAYSVPAIEGTAAQVRGWSYGNFPKRDATRFFRAVKKFGNPSQIGLIAAEVGGVVEAAPTNAQIELFEALIDGCREAVKGGSYDPKGPTLDFFGILIKANELLSRVEGLQLLAKRISRYADPIAQFRALMYLKPATWSKGCGWNQKDDAKLLLGIHYHGFGNWEKIRLDEKLGLTKKIAPVELQHHETFLPRAPNLNDRASQLLEMELVAVGEKNSNAKASGKVSKKQRENVLNISMPRSKGKQGKQGSSKLDVQTNRFRQLKAQKAEPLMKEEGEMSDTEEVYEQFKEVKWMEWCEDVMVEEEKTLKRLQRLQSTSADLPKEKVLSKIRKYLQLLGRRIDQIVLEYEDEPYRQERMTTRLWNYVSTFSNLSGERLNQIYSKLKVERQEAGVGPSHFNGSAPGPLSRPRGLKNQTLQHTSALVHRGTDTGKSESWKLQRKPESDSHSQVHPPHQRPMSNGTHIPDPNSSGILGSGPSDSRNYSNERPYKMRQTGLPPRQGFS
ncbi:protein CHROMATIN REMODELING 5 isoform X4 [Rhododendron vialii]|uniref:protein CHROMATIN REMODELING 5 isoform X4 n=1 Tax=Rhododendron vialii TaxID=182163 RepID=UPI00265FA4AE|nr:protein CHROMATIN REMODELING 5 isoform X4 [Rhododendron vialii]